MTNLALIPLLLTTTLVFIDTVTSTPHEMFTASLLKNSNQQLNDVEDSPLERVHLKQETGFDGKVRSIQFNFENEKSPEFEDDPRAGLKFGDVDMAKEASYPSFSKLQSDSDSTFSTLDTMPSSGEDKIAQVNEMPKKLPFSNSHLDQQSQDFAELSRVKRLIEESSSNNNVGDLQTAEAKVFRPLFVYRQQVARRLKLQNARRLRRQGIQPNNYEYPYPYRYPVYNYYPYRY